ncbi:MULTISPECIES: hypothetical protein [Microbacterium]|nr:MULTISPECIES: hypothetical protein [Microbacterium]MCV0334304.1 hypothetical protein [Microbacterium sp.]MCV0376130.1 hypothetical protein [Microbacterium sp.]MCV0390070.1 hypothetical protein [Microbacterium sp.]MCV0417805.1 hypothetical protein [Microbacterium sp.]MCV0422527.1 hypothetical protein [Microbacterium sp.]
MDLALSYAPDRIIPIPGERLSPQEQVTWARQTAEDFARDAGAHSTVAAQIETALLAVAAQADDDRRLLLVVGVDGGVVAPLMISVITHELSRQEQADFLWSSTAILPVTPRLTETDALGTGFSSTLAQRENGLDFATRRWIFFGEGTTVCAMLGPVVPYGMAFVEPFAEAVLTTASLSDFVPRSDPERLEELVSAVVRPGDDWVLNG